ncbi:hypothetical protein [Inmirania thermothiophila]|uniref:Alpha/beta hydrolase n=1 Tax=Inmirania thermothiophila TaxID=1750597 RepID=A0A3N1Y1V6_9GAMM|nr:hypothetical protein [Inmirania thermothiophila]ROR32799.1 hypothetical protein EDC57_2011 [Inmirania thermothiophila]
MTAAVLVMVAGLAQGAGVQRLRTPEGVRYHAWFPEERPAGLVVSVHGISRNAAEHVRRLAPAAAAAGYAVVAPLLPPGRFRGFQRLRAGAAEAVEDVVADAAARAGRPFPRFVLVGFSGGAQFAHRYAMLRPGRIESLLLGAAGWYTLPDPALPWPLGVAPGTAPAAVDLAGFLRLPVTVVVGADDTRRDVSLNADPAVDRLLGRNRLERARRWVAALRARRRAGGAPVRLRVLPGVGHDFAEAARAGLVDALAEALGVAPRRHVTRITAAASGGG